MLKRPLVSMFQSIKVNVKGKRYYCKNSNNKEMNICSNNQYKNEINEILEKQEKNHIIISEQLTNQKKVIEKLTAKINEMEIYASNSRLIQVFTLFNGIIVIFFK